MLEHTTETECPILAEIYRMREKHAEQCQGDFDIVCDDFAKQYKIIREERERHITDRKRAARREKS